MSTLQESVIIESWLLVIVTSIVLANNNFHKLKHIIACRTEMLESFCVLIQWVSTLSFCKTTSFHWVFRSPSFSFGIACKLMLLSLTVHVHISCIITNFLLICVEFDVFSWILLHVLIFVPADTDIDLQIIDCGISANWIPHNKQRDWFEATSQIEGGGFCWCTQLHTMFLYMVCFTFEFRSAEICATFIH